MQIFCQGGHLESEVNHANYSQDMSDQVLEFFCFFMLNETTLAYKHAVKLG